MSKSNYTPRTILRDWQGKPIPVKETAPTAMIITLLDPRVQFIARSRGAIHATITATQTMCGVATDETMLVRDNSMEVTPFLCQRCYRSLKKYGPGFVKVESEVAG